MMQSCPETVNVRVVVPCSHSDSTIEPCITSILKSRGIDFELVMVDDGGNSRLEELADQFRIKLIRTGGSEGAGKARNTGASGFKGSVVVFIDSDVKIFPDTLRLLTSPVLERSVHATTGCYARVRRNNFFETYKHYYLACKYSSDRKTLKNTFWSAICAVDFDAFSGLNGFSESFSGAGPEDIDFGIDLSGSGFKIASVPRAMGVHLARHNLKSLIHNDLRKGTEDIYIHWKRQINLGYNRHVSKADSASVFFACLIPLLLLLLPVAGIIPLVTCIIFYMASRTGFLKKAFWGEDRVFMIKSFFLTLILDLIRGLSVIQGTAYYIIELLSSGKYKPFARQMKNSLP